MSPDSGINELAGLSPEEQEKQKQEWLTELAKVRFVYTDFIGLIFLNILDNACEKVYSFLKMI